MDWKPPCSLCPLWLDSASNDPTIDNIEGLDVIEVATIKHDATHHLLR